MTVAGEGDRAALERRIRELEEMVAQLRAAHASAQARIENLNQALRSARRIGVAVGMLTQGGLSEEQAFELLRTTSIHSGRKVRDLAEDILRTGELPKAEAAERPPRPRTAAPRIGVPRFSD